MIRYHLPILSFISFITIFTPLLAMGEDEASSQNTFQQDDWIIDVGVFWAGVDTKIRADGKNGGRGAEVDLENDLGLSDREALFDMALYYKGWNRWVIGLEWFELRRNTMHVLEKDIDWNDIIFPIGVETNSYFDLNVVRLSVTYRLLDTPRARIGVGFGVHGTGAKAGIKGVLSAGPEDNFGVETESEVETGAIIPLPNFGIWGTYVFSDKFIGLVNLEGFAMNYEEYSGSLWRLEASLRYEASDYLSLGIGYAYFHVEVDLDKKLWHGQLEFSYYGPKLFAYFTF